jgi:hypothetical protein
MNPITREQTGATSYIDYRPSRCRCGAVIRPYEIVCLQCGRRQNLLFEGLEKIGRDDLDGIIAKLDGDVQKSPYDYVKLFRLANAHLLRGRYEVARDIYRRLLQIKPDFSPARLNLGAVLACIGDSEAAAAELRQYVRQDPHSPKAERAIRAICSIKNIPYEDALKETGVWQPKGPARRKGEPEPVGLGKKSGRGSVYVLPRKRAVRSWGAIDVFLLFLIVVVLAAWFAFPGQSRTVLAATIVALEKPFAFQVTNTGQSGQGASGGAGQNEQGQTSVAGQEPSSMIVNAHPATNSYFPLQAGNTWTYVAFDTRDPSGVNDRENMGTRTITVSGLVNATQGIWRVKNSGQSEDEFYVEKPTGLFAILELDTPWASSIAVVPYPATVGRTLTTLDQSVTVEAEEDVRTPAGTFHCVRLKYTVRGTELTWTAWYGQGVGLVKYRGGGTNDGMYHMLELGRYTLK